MSPAASGAAALAGQGARQTQGFRKALSSRLRVAACLFGVSAHSQILSTRQPFLRSPRVVSASRAWFRAIFSRQNFRFCLGCVP